MRLFAFGCSLTQYFYHKGRYFNSIIEIKVTKQPDWAKSGAGNVYINCRLWEANTVHKFNKDDVILPWTRTREDRYLWDRVGGHRKL